MMNVLHPQTMMITNYRHNQDLMLMLMMMEMKKIHYHLTNQRKIGVSCMQHIRKIGIQIVHQMNQDLKDFWNI